MSRWFLLVLWLLPSLAGSQDYPGLKLGDLDAAERKTFERVLRGEMCPCGMAMSLAKCLKRDDVCGRARDAAGLVAARIRQGDGYGEAVDAMIAYLEASSKPKTFDLSNSPFKGNPKASVVLVEFSDFECPHCNKVRPALAAVLAKYPQDVVLYFKHFPLPFHTHAADAAAASMVAHARGKFWQMHDLNFDHQQELSTPNLYRFLAQLGIPKGSITEADWKRAQAHVVADVQDGDAAGVGGTPTVFLNGIALSSDDYEPEALLARVKQAINAGKK